MRSNIPVSARFTFHNVGQGLFYSGKINNFNFIYDCGSDNKNQIESVVENYKRNDLQGDHIGLLVISHLHSDHINGLYSLLYDSIGCQTTIDTVMLPYLEPTDRLMVALESSNPPEWLRDFWADPIYFLARKGVKRIILFGQNEPRPPEDDYVFQDYRFNNETDDKINVDKLPDDEDLIHKVQTTESSVVSRMIADRRLSAKRHDSSLLLAGFWIFRFFNRKVEDAFKTRFESCVRSVNGKDSLEEIIHDRKKLGALRHCYSKLGGDFNDTSLVLYHGPLRGKPLQASFAGSFPCRYLSFMTIQSADKLTILHPSAVDYLLTGDINLNLAWPQMKVHFGSKLSRLDMALVPHHGSLKNWNQDVLKTTTNQCCWVISAGTNNKYGHPDKGVCSEITNNGNTFRCTNEAIEILTRSLLYP
ncbi:MAG: MBL fold metallo-hydrolase [Candidatus Bathyarchaeota archaeon]|nr:MBL fold metallo-hydrolase [Candidatus Bathyarchaeota archaeon]